MASLRIAVQGCCHGRLDDIYAHIKADDLRVGKHTQLLLICGDFQACRNEADLACMACPDKYKDMNTFHDYFAGRKVAPVLTVFIGGNHEASNYMQELFYGGWVAPNIFYLGCAGVIKVGGWLRIAGLSGIYNEQRYKNNSPRHEYSPYTPGSMRSVYHVRPLQAMQLFLLGEMNLSGGGNIRTVDIFLSHDWPQGIVSHGDKEGLLRKKKFLRQDVDNGSLGSQPAAQLLTKLQPRFWFSAHLHCRFTAEVRHCIEEHKSAATGITTADKHSNSSLPDFVAQTLPKTEHRVTRFVALDKCLPNRQFLEFFEIEPPMTNANATSDEAVPGTSQTGQELQIEYDCEWLAIIRATHEYVAKPPSEIPPPAFLRQHVAKSREAVHAAFEKTGYVITRELFVQTAPLYNPPPPHQRKQYRNRVFQMPPQAGNPQTDILLDRLGLKHIPPVTVPFVIHAHVTGAALASSAPTDENELDIDL